MRRFITKELAIQSVFMLIFTILPCILGYYGGIVALLLLLILTLTQRHLKSGTELYSDKKLLIVFLIIYLLLLINVVLTALGLYKYFELNENDVKVTIKIAGLALSFILLRISKVSIHRFTWKMNRPQLVTTLLIAITFSIITVPFDGFIFINRFKGNLIEYAFYIVSTFFLVAFFEEFLCRGILVSALRGYQISDWKINLLQAILFGALHCVRYLDKGVGIALLVTCYQTVIGYFLGKLYFKTKSLTPGILIHLLWDIL